MAKKYSKKFWLIFWSVSIVLLAGFWFFLEIRNRPVKTFSRMIELVPGLDKKKELETAAYLADYLLKKDNEKKSFLILFQNNMELRPGGGFIGTFGVLKMENGTYQGLETFDLSNFDAAFDSGIASPYPIEEVLGTASWKLRDANWSPDFPENAEKAEELYRLGNGREEFDGVVAINTDVLTSFLEVTGPISLPDYPGTYDSQNAILTLEYQVEKGYAEQGIEKKERKSVMNELAGAIMEEVLKLNFSKKIELAKIILDDLDNKDIQLYFKDAGLQKKVRTIGWSGEVARNSKKDYLLMLDANLGAFKSDYYMEREFDYVIDLTGEKPKADLKIAYTHTGKVKDWMTRDYLSYLRVYVPEGAWLESSNVPDVRFGNEASKKYFGGIVKVPLKETWVFSFSYILPENLDLYDGYDLLIQKQSGVSGLSGRVVITEKDGKQKSYEVDSATDWKLGE